jgi:hypothetical protein
MTSINDSTKNEYQSNGGRKMNWLISTQGWREGGRRRSTLLTNLNPLCNKKQKFK